MIVFFLFLGLFLPAEGNKAPAGKPRENVVDFLARSGIKVAAPQTFTGTCPLRRLRADGQAHRMCFPNKVQSFGFGDEIIIAGVIGVPYFTVELNLLSTIQQNLMHLRIRHSCKANTRIVFNNRNLKGQWQKEERHPYSLKDFNGKNLWHRLKNTPEGITFELNFWEWEEGICSDQPYIAKYLFKHRTANPATDYKYLTVVKPTSMQFGSVIYRSAALNTSEVIPFNKEMWTDPK